MSKVSVVYVTGCPLLQYVKLAEILQAYTFLFVKGSTKGAQILLMTDFHSSMTGILSTFMQTP